MRDLIIKDYQECVALSNAPRELKEALRSNQRVPKFIDNLVMEIKKTERILFMRGKSLDRKKIKDLVYSMTEFFLHNLKAKADADYTSSLEKIRQQQREAELQKIDNNGNVDLSEECGVLIKDAEETNENQKRQEPSR